MSLIKTPHKSGDLWRGCVLSTIVHAVWLVRHPELAHEQSWDGLNYNVQDTMGSLGTVTFGTEGTVGAFFDSHSPRSPFRTGARRESSELLARMPAPLRALADGETLQYLLQEFDGEVQPIITAAFWTEADDLVAAEPWEDVLTNGGHLIQTQLLEPAAALKEWQKHYSLSPGQGELIWSLFSRKMADPHDKVLLTDSEASAIFEPNAPGTEEAKSLLQQIGLMIPEAG